jgi:hypothetical protein
MIRTVEHPPSFLCLACSRGGSRHGSERLFPDEEIRNDLGVFLAASLTLLSIRRIWKVLSNPCVRTDRKYCVHSPTMMLVGSAGVMKAILDQGPMAIVGAAH